MTLPEGDINSDEVVVSVSGIGKQYHLFDDPQDRLKHMLFWRLGKTYGRLFWAVQNVSFDLHRGEMLGIIGKNGSGKSTLLQMIAGTLNPTEGTILCNRRVGALLELGSGFNPEYTGRENIQLNASILGITSDELKGKIQSIIDFADIGEFIDQPVKVYSSGMFVRLAFAVTTGLDAEVLLIDEALAVGDVFFRQKCYRRLEEMRMRGVSIILVTHSMGDVEQYCSSAIVLRNGKPVFQGSALEAVKWYYLEDQSLDPSLIRKTVSSDGDNYVQLKIGGWPDAEAYFDLSHDHEISNDWAHCTGVALCDEQGKPARIFQQGDFAQFIFNFDILEDIEVPNAGLVLHNEKGWAVHGKGTLLYGTIVPSSVKKGCRIRVIQKIKLELDSGEYTFEVALNTMPNTHYLLRSKLSPQDLYSKIIRICFLPKVGPFTIVNRQSGTPVSLSHHGVANLPGSSELQVY